jgi:hypothetical protein
MMHEFTVYAGDICEDPIGLRVKVEDVDMYDYVHFSVLESDEPEDDTPESGEMSHVAFVHRFSKLGNTSARSPGA